MSIQIWDQNREDMLFDVEGSFLICPDTISHQGGDVADQQGSAVYRCEKGTGPGEFFWRRDSVVSC